MQSRRMSFVESWANVGVGFCINVLANYTLLPLFGLHPTVADSAALAIIFTLISLARSYCLRRAFNRMGVRPVKTKP